MKKLFLLAVMALGILLLVKTAKSSQGEPPYSIQVNDWVDSVYQTLNDTQRVGQLFMIPAYSNGKAEDQDKLSSLIKEYGIGGLIFMQGGPLRQAQLTNRFQSESKVPMLIAMDAEWGLSMRLDSCLKYPFQMTLGALHNNNLVYEMGRAMARDFKRIGVNMSFSPDVDVNTNPDNPVINYRSFGEDPDKVSEKSLALMQGLQDEQVLACAKHFPGHGNTNADSHFSLPTIAASKKALDSVELKPFKNLIQGGVASVMIAHLNVPSVTGEPGLPTTLSSKTIEGLLRKELDFEGLVITDALNMKGLTQSAKPGEAELRAFMAGNDILLFSQDVPEATKRILQYVHSKKHARFALEKHVKRILSAKYWCGLAEMPVVKIDSLYEDLNSTNNRNLIRKLYEESVVLVKNKNEVFPWKGTERGVKSFCLAVGNPSSTQSSLSAIRQYLMCDTLSMTWKSSAALIEKVVSQLKGQKNPVIISFHLSSQSPGKNFEVQKEWVDKLLSVTPKNSAVLVFGNPYALQNFRKAGAILSVFEDNEFTRRAAVSVMFGGKTPSGKLPVRVADVFALQEGMNTCESDALIKIAPEQIGINSSELLAVDSIIDEGIRKGAFPGCQILAAKNNQVFYHKSFGNTSYQSGQPISEGHIYDLASVTKIAASALILMKLHDEGKLHLDSPLINYLPESEGTNKADLTLKEILTHQAGLIPWIPFWRQTMIDGQWDPQLYCEFPYDSINVRVAQNLYLHQKVPDSMYRQILNSGLTERGKYVYSDLGYYLMRKLIERLEGKPFEQVADEFFYFPMGLTHTGFLPRNWSNQELWVPTENDTEFRKQLLVADVHDQGAAMLGGISGHAGLFSNSFDLATLLWLLLNKGEYQGKRYLSESVINLFTQPHFPGNRRGICFDKSEPDPGKPQVTAASSSKLTFGHTGFTGTCAWVDPENKLIYVFLSNRVHPNAENKKLSELKIRGRVQEVFNQALRKSIEVN